MPARAWHIEVIEGASTAMFVRGMSLQPGRFVALVDGCTITAGAVRLTFYQRGSLSSRLDEEQRRQASGI